MNDIIQSLNDYINNTSNEIDVPIYVEHHLPQLLYNNKLEDFIYSTVPEALKADVILSAFKVKREAEYKRSHKKGSIPNYYELYCSFANPKYLLTKQQYYDIFSDFFDIPLSGSEYNLNTKVVKAIQTLSSIGESTHSILLFLNALWSDSSSLFIPDIKDLDAESEYNQTRKLTYADAKRLLMPIKNNMLDAICAVMTDMDYNDVPLENISVLQLFSNSVKNSIAIKEPIIIIEPSPFLIKKLRGNNPFRKRDVVFCLQDKLLIDIYSQIFNSSGFSFISINELDSFMSSIDLYPTNVLLFGNHINNIELKTTCINFCLSHVNNSHTLYIFDSDYFIQNKTSPIKKALSEILINNIWLFPSGIINTTKPEMKTLLQCTYGYMDKSKSNICITKYTLSSNGKEQYLSPYYFQADISSEDFFSDNIKLRTFYRTKQLESQAKSNNTRNHAEIYPYSSEIDVHYTVSGEGTKTHPFRVSAYLREPNSNNKKSQVLAETRMSTKKISPDKIEVWIENNYLKAISIRKAISDIYQSFYQDRSITLKTFILFSYEWEETLPPKALNDLTFINHSLIADMDINRITYDDILAVLDNEIQYTHARMVLLSELFDLAIKQGYCNFNPVKNELRSTQKNHVGLYQVRANLKNKTLNVNNYNYTFNHLTKKYRNGDKQALASMISLLTGLDPNIICALKWRDICNICVTNGEETITFTQFIIQRQLCNDGSEIKQLSRREQYRKLPCPSILSNYIVQEYEDAKRKHIGMPQEYIDDCFIFTCDNTNTPIAPSNLRKKNRKLIRKLNIPPDVIPIPDNSKGTIDTNLAYYPGDIFRTSIDYYARHYGFFETGEEEYFLGIQASTTFSRNYCDYSKDKAQLNIYTKLERIIKKLFYKDIFKTKKERIKIKETFSLVSSSDSHDLSFIGIDLSIPENVETTISINTKHGYNLSIQELEDSHD